MSHHALYHNRIYAPVLRCWYYKLVVLVYVLSVWCVVIVAARSSGLLFPNAVIFHLRPVLCVPHGYDPYLTSVCTATTALRLSL